MWTKAIAIIFSRKQRYYAGRSIVGYDNGVNYNMLLPFNPTPFHTTDNLEFILYSLQYIALLGKFRGAWRKKSLAILFSNFFFSLLNSAHCQQTAAPSY